MRPSSLFCFSILLSLVLPSHGSDIARERRIAEQIVDAIFDGESVTLRAAGHQFLGIYMESSAAISRNGAIILHGRGLHPDWERVVKPLRTGLPAHGWTTLSLQMPVLEKEAKYYDYVPIFHEAIPRIEAGIDFLRQQGIDNIVLIAHSCGAHMSMEFIRQRGDDPFRAYVGIGMGATDYQQPMAEPFPLKAMAIPVLDLYGEDDYPAVRRMAQERLSAIKEAGHPLSRQHVIPKSDHYHEGREAELIQAVAAWLESLPL